MKRRLYSLFLFVIAFACNKETVFDYPLVLIGDVTNITDTSATFTARISNYGNHEISETGFMLSVYPNDKNGHILKNDNEISKTFSLQTNESLIPGKTFYVTAYVKTAVTTTYSKEIFFQSGSSNCHPGRWSLLYKSNELLQEDYIHFKSSFTINQNTYFVFGSNKVYCYDHSNNTLNYHSYNNILAQTKYCFAFKDLGYIVTWYGIYEFDPSNKRYSEIWVQDDLMVMIAFQIEDNIFLIFEDKSMLKYNLSDYSWQQMTSFPGHIDYSIFAFNVHDRGYIGAAQKDRWSYTNYFRLWAYTLETNMWIQKVILDVTGVRVVGPLGMNTENFGYCLNNGQLFEYNPVYNIWEEKTDFNLDQGVSLFTKHNNIFAFQIHPFDSRHHNINIWVYEK